MPSELQSWSPPLIREWIQLPVRLDAVPPGGHAVRLEDQEEHDREAEDAELERGEELHQLRQLIRQRAGDDAEHFGQERDERGAEDRAEHAAEAADEDHAE